MRWLAEHRVAVALIAVAVVAMAVVVGFVATRPASQPQASGSPGTTPSPVVSPSPSAEPGSPAVSASAPSTTTAGADRCHTSQLEVGYEFQESAGGATTGKFEVRNASSVPCYVEGYVGMGMLDASGRPLPTSTTRVSGNHPVTRIVLPPGTPALAPGNTSQGHAYFNADWNNGGCEPQPDNSPASWLVTPPDETAALQISAHPAAPPNAGKAIVCNGILRVEPLEAAAYTD